MKHLLSVIVFLTLCQGAQAQADSVVVWNKWCARKDTMLLFNSGNNVIQIVSPTLKPADIKIRSLDKSLRIGAQEIKGDTINVMAMPFPDKGKNMRLAIQYKKTGKPIRTISFVSDSIPVLLARLGNIQAGEARRKDILNQSSIRISFPKSLYSYPYSLRQYTFKVQSAKGSATIPVKGFFLTKDVQQAIKDAPDGTVLQFTDIKASCPDCAVRTLPDIRLKVMQ